MRRPARNLRRNRAQPYRAGKGVAGPAKSAQKRGRTAFGRNPADAKRAIQKRRRKRRKVRR